MNVIKHRLTIKMPPAKVYEAITTQQGIESWWCRQTTAQPQVGFVNVFVFGQARNEFNITELIPEKKVAWVCLDSAEEWIGTHVIFGLEEKNGNTVLQFTHGGWADMTDFYASCNYAWANFLGSLKSYCENGTGMPA